MKVDRNEQYEVLSHYSRQRSMSVSHRSKAMQSCGYKKYPQMTFSITL